MLFDASSKDIDLQRKGHFTSSSPLSGIELFETNPPEEQASHGLLGQTINPERVTVTVELLVAIEMM